MILEKKMVVVDMVSKKNMIYYTKCFHSQNSGSHCVYFLFIFLMEGMKLNLRGFGFTDGW